VRAMKWMCFILLWAILLPCKAQKDSTHHSTKLIVPVALIAYGSLATYTSWGSAINKDVKSIINNGGNHTTKVDDYLVPSSAVAVYALNALGVASKNNFRDRSMLLATSYVTAYVVTSSTKSITRIWRPDSTTYNSFPSGHTALAFAGAEFLRREYQDQSAWYGIAGYAAATTVAGLRIYNNRHWLSDVAAGAGVGILSTQLAYALQPFYKKRILKEVNALVLPEFMPEHKGLSLSIVF
jgi:membrane-associated phospholipid phosphatase